MQDKTPPKVSVCVLTFNHGEMLRECLESIVNQKTSFHFEVLVGDDASTDNETKNIVKSYANAYPEIIVPIIREKNLGPSDNYFDLLRRSKGKYFAHMDGDDIMLPGKLERQVKILDEHPDVYIVAHSVIEIGNSLVAREINPDDGVDYFGADHLLRKGCFFVHSSKMYRRDRVKTWESIDFVVDYHLHLEHSAGGKIAYIKDVLGCYRHHAAGISKQVRFKKIIQDAYDRAFLVAIDLGFEPSLVNYGRIRHRQAVALTALASGDFDVFQAYSRISSYEKPYASPRQIFVSYLGRMPMVARFLMLIRRGIPHRNYG